MKNQSPRSRASKILTAAIDKTDKVQDELHVAAENLGNANAVLSNPLASSQAVAAVASAVAQNVAAEVKVQEAVEELEVVKELIKDAQVEQSADQANGNKGEGTASILAYFEGRRAQARDDEAKQGG